MRKRFSLIICTVMILSFSVVTLSFAGVIDSTVKNDSTLVKNSNTQKNSAAKVLFFHYLDDVYQTANLSQYGLDSVVFQKAMTAYYNLLIAKILPAKSSTLTVIDFSDPDTNKRLWIIDLQQKKVLLNTKIADSQLNGDQQENNIGFYLTNEISAENNQTLGLKGLDNGINNFGSKNEPVIIGVNNISVNNTNSPAVTNADFAKIAALIKSNSLLFINRNSDSYTSNYLDEDSASKYAFADSSFNLVKDIFGN